MDFWKGIVVDIMDPLQSGRVRVRVFGHHTPNIDELPNSCLPWAMISISPNVGSNSGVGASPNGITLNSLVIGYFDDPYGQQPIIIGVLPRPHFKIEDEEKEIEDGFSGNDSNNLNGFLDLREEEELKNYPVTIKKIEYLPGKEVNIENNDPELYPREKYYEKMSPSIISSNIEGIEETLIETKRKILDKGGLLENYVQLAVYPTGKYEVVPNSIFPIGRKASFIAYNESNKYSSDRKSDFTNYAAVKETNRINSNNEKIYKENKP